MKSRPKPEDLRLEPPEVFLFSGKHCSRAYALNKFAFAFKYSEVRREYLEQPEALMEAYKLPEAQRQMLRNRDWTALVTCGGHHWNIMKIAFAVGESHLHVGAHMASKSWKEIQAELPYDIDLMPEDFKADV